MSSNDEFSTAFSTAFDDEASASVSPGGVCFPPGADWGCSFTQQEIDSLDPDAKRRAEALAWMQLAALTADQVGTCPIVVRPCNEGCRPAGTYVSAPASRRAGFNPHLNDSGTWVNGCGCTSGDCSCSALCEAILPGPVGHIVEVWLNGALLPSSAYRVDNGTRLVRTDGGCWPGCQDMAASAHGAGAFSVTYYRGAAPDALSLWMAGLLAVEYYKACNSDKTCRLPNRLQSVARQGVTYQVAFSDGETTGIREVDDFVNRLNPYHLKMPPVIVSPQSRRPRQTTWSR